MINFYAWTTYSYTYLIQKMVGRRLTLELLVLAAVVMMGTSAQTLGREYCSMTFTSPDECLCKAKSIWQTQGRDVASAQELLKKSCDQLEVRFIIIK